MPQGIPSKLYVNRHINETTGCWEWTRSKFSAGHGQVVILFYLHKAKNSALASGFSRNTPSILLVTISVLCFFTPLHA